MGVMRVREISKKHWDMSFEKWMNMLKNGYSSAMCGYCLDAKTRKPSQLDSTFAVCILDNKICDDIDSYYMKWDTAVRQKTRDKYARLILQWTIDEGHRLGYITPEQVEVAKGVMG